jgi:hypothetical protein
VSACARGVAAFALLACAPACTFVGATVGSVIPRSAPLSETEREDPTLRDAAFDPESRAAGTEAPANGAPAPSSNPVPLAGNHGGGYDRKLWTSAPEQDERAPKEARQGNYFLEGLLVGLAVDLTVIAIIGSRAGDFLPDPNGRHFHVGADGVEVKAR